MILDRWVNLIDYGLGFIGFKELHGFLFPCGAFGVLWLLFPDVQGSFYLEVHG